MLVLGYLLCNDLVSVAFFSMPSFSFLTPAQYSSGLQYSQAPVPCPLHYQMFKIFINRFAYWEILPRITMNNKSKGTRINPVLAILQGPENNNKNVGNCGRFELVTLKVHVYNERNKLIFFSDIMIASCVPKSHDSCL